MEIGIHTFFFLIFSIGLSRSCGHGREVCRLTRIDLYIFSYCLFNLNLFFIYFYHSILSCSIIEFHDFIQIFFECGYSNITTGSKVLNLDLRELKSSFFILFLVIFFLNLCSSIFYFPEIKLQLFFFELLYSHMSYQELVFEFFSCVSFY